MCCIYLQGPVPQEFYLYSSCLTNQIRKKLPGGLQFFWLERQCLMVHENDNNNIYGSRKLYCLRSGLFKNKKNFDLTSKNSSFF